MRDFFRTGWKEFRPDPQVLDWLKIAGPTALVMRRDPDMIQKWLRCEQTWFVGVNALANDGKGRVAGSAPLTGEAMAFVRGALGFGDGALDRAQVSICYPGYPKPQAGETAAAFRFRRDRDAAHLDGMHPVGPARRRKMLEFHGFILGLPITNADKRAAPLVVWEGSHHIMARAIRAALSDIAPDDWPGIDLTDIYQNARKLVFERCKRRLVHARPGGAYILHRLALHGVSPWLENAKAPPEGRAILYFRPEIARENWLCEDPDQVDMVNAPPARSGS